MGKGHFEDMPEVTQLFDSQIEKPDISSVTVYDLANYFRKRIGVPYRDLVSLCSFNHWKSTVPGDRSISLLSKRLFLSKDEENDLRQVAEKERGKPGRGKESGTRG